MHMLERAEALNTALETSWGEELAAALTENEDAALGFALARALTLKWITLDEDISTLFDAAEAALSDLSDEEDDEDDDDDDD